MVKSARNRAHYFFLKNSDNFQFFDTLTTFQLLLNFSVEFFENRAKSPKSGSGHQNRGTIMYLVDGGWVVCAGWCGCVTDKVLKKYGMVLAISPLN